MDNINLLKKYAYTYLSKYDSTKKNLELKLKNKVMRMKNLESDEKNDLYKIILEIIENLETNKVSKFPQNIFIIASFSCPFFGSESTYVT